MASGYPGALDSYTTKVDGVDDVLASHVNELQSAVVAIETELGTDPAGPAATVVARLLKNQGAAATELTVASGVLTLTQRDHKIQPETGTADDITDLAGGVAGQWGVLEASDAGTDTLTFKHGTGNISCFGAADIALSEGIVVYYYNGTTYKLAGGGGGGGITASSSDTFTNKTIIDSSNTIEELTTVASSATPTPTGGSLRNRLTITALAAAAELQAPSGTPADGHLLMVRWKDNGTARALTYNAIYRGISATLAATTTISKTLYQLFMYNSADSKWDLIAQEEQP